MHIQFIQDTLTKIFSLLVAHSAEFSLLMAGLTLIIAALTLLVTVLSVAATGLGLFLAYREYKRQRAMIEPWSMTKVGDSLWMLKHNTPELAMISGIIAGEMCENYDYVFRTPSGMPTTRFRQGTTVLINMENAYAGNSFIIWYEEYKDESAMIFNQNYRVPYQERYNRPPHMKEWITTLY